MISSSGSAKKRKRHFSSLLARSLITPKPWDSGSSDSSDEAQDQHLEDYFQRATPFSQTERKREERTNQFKDESEEDSEENSRERKGLFDSSEEDSGDSLSASAKWRNRFGGNRENAEPTENEQDVLSMDTFSVEETSETSDNSDRGLRRFEVVTNQMRPFPLQRGEKRFRVIDQEAWIDCWWVLGDSPSVKKRKRTGRTYMY